MSRILFALHFQGAMRRGPLSEHCRIRKSSVTNLSVELLQRNVVGEEPPGHMRSTLSLNAEGPAVFAVSILPDHFRFGLLQMDGRFRCAFSRPLEVGVTPELVVEEIAEAFEKTLSDWACPLWGLGCAAQGEIDPHEGQICRSLNMGWEQVPLRAMLEERLGLPTVVDNNVRCQLWSAVWFDRLLQDYENILYVSLQEGVAVSMVLHGRRLVGGHFSAGELGHVPVGSEGRPCKCGRTDCVEAYCSVPSVLRDIEARAPELAPLRKVQQLADLAPEQPVLREVLEHTSRYLAQALHTLVAVLDPDALVFATESEAFTEYFKPMLTKHLYGELLGKDPETLALLSGGPIEDTALRGAGALMLEKVFQRGELEIHEEALSASH